MAQSYLAGKKFHFATPSVQNFILWLNLVLFCWYKGLYPESYISFIFDVSWFFDQLDDWRIASVFM